MAEKRNLKIFFKSLPTATSPDARWGMVGIVAGFLLFAPPLVFYFFEKGGILMLPSWVWITFGVSISVVWVAVAVISFLMFWRWWTTPRTNNNITAEQIKDLLEQLINEIRQDRNECNKS